MPRRRKQVAYFTLLFTTLATCTIGIVGCSQNQFPVILRAEQNAMTNDAMDGSASMNDTQNLNVPIHESMVKQDGSAQLSNRHSVTNAMSERESDLSLGDHVADSAVLGPQRFMPGGTWGE